MLNYNLNNSQKICLLLVNLLNYIGVVVFFFFFFPKGTTPSESVDLVKPVVQQVLYSLLTQ